MAIKANSKKPKKEERQASLGNSEQVVTSNEAPVKPERKSLLPRKPKPEQQDLPPVAPQELTMQYQQNEEENPAKVAKSAKTAKPNKKSPREIKSSTKKESNSATQKRSGRANTKLFNSGSLSEASIKGMTTLQIIKDNESKLAFTTNFMTDFSKSKTESLQDLESVISQSLVEVAPKVNPLDISVPPELSFTQQTPVEISVAQIIPEIIKPLSQFDPSVVSGSNFTQQAESPIPNTQSIPLGSDEEITDEELEEELVEEELVEEELVEEELVEEELVEEELVEEGLVEEELVEEELVEEELVEEGTEQVATPIFGALKFGEDEPDTDLNELDKLTGDSKNIENGLGESVVPTTENDSSTTEPQAGIVSEPSPAEGTGFRLTEAEKKVLMSPLTDQHMDEEISFGQPMNNSPRISSKTFDLDVEKQLHSSVQFTSKVNNELSINADSSESSTSKIIESMEPIKETVIKGFDDAYSLLGGK